MNVIDIGSSNIRSYFVDERGVVNIARRETNPETIIPDTLDAFNEVGFHDAQATFVISTSDSIAVERHSGMLEWLPHAEPDVWFDGLTPYEYSGHPRFDPLRGAANQMRYIQHLMSLDSVKRILPISAMVAAKIAGHEDWNVWDYTHASNSGFYNFRTGGWADEARPFIEAGVINEHIAPPIEKIPADPSMRQVYLGGHDSVFSNATDIPYSTKSYVSCGTWTTVSVATLLRGDPPIPDTDNRNRFLLSPNGAVLKQRCFQSDPDDLDTTVQTIVDFIHGEFQSVKSISPISVFGTWSNEIIERLYKWDTGYNFQWIPPTEEWGCVRLPLKVREYVLKNDPNYIGHSEYYSEGA